MYSGLFFFLSLTKHQGGLFILFLKVFNVQSVLGGDWDTGSSAQEGET